MTNPAHEAMRARMLEVLDLSTKEVRTELVTRTATLSDAGLSAMPRLHNGRLVAHVGIAHMGVLAECFTGRWSRQHLTAVLNTIPGSEAGVDEAMRWGIGNLPATQLVAVRARLGNRWVEASARGLRGHVRRQQGTWTALDTIEQARQWLHGNEDTDRLDVGWVLSHELDSASRHDMGMLDTQHFSVRSHAPVHLHVDAQNLYLCSEHGSISHRPTVLSVRLAMELVSDPRLDIEAVDAAVGQPSMSTIDVGRSLNDAAFAWGNGELDIASAEFCLNGHRVTLSEDGGTLDGKGFAPLDWEDIVDTLLED